jgi:hypothetical protein
MAVNVLAVDAEGVPWEAAEATTPDPSRRQISNAILTHREAAVVDLMCILLRLIY